MSAEHSPRVHRHLHCPIEGCGWHSFGVIYDDEHRSTIPLPLSCEFTAHCWLAHTEVINSTLDAEHRLTAEQVRHEVEENPSGFIESVRAYNQQQYGQDEAPLITGAYN